MKKQQCDSTTTSSTKQVQQCEAGVLRLSLLMEALGSKAIKQNFDTYLRIQETGPPTKILSAACLNSVRQVIGALQDAVSSVLREA